MTRKKNNQVSKIMSELCLTLVHQVEQSQEMLSG